MVSVSLLILLLIAVATASVAVGAHLGLQFRQDRPEPSPAPPIRPAQTDGSKDTLDRERVRELLLRLHQVSTGIADDVNEHSRTVETITQELSSLSENTGDCTESDVIRLVSDIVRANGELQTQLVDATETIDEQAREIQCHLHEALTDALTEIPNRRAFDHELRRRFAEKSRQGCHFSLLMLDVDHFKQFNDRYGHQAGDDVLRGVAGVLAESLNDMDVAARYGGEEFAAILPRSSLSHAMGTAERVRKAVETANLPTDGGNRQVTVSVGLAEALPQEDPASLVKRSDMALYAAKEHGRNRAYFHNGKTCQSVLGPDGKLVDCTVGAAESCRAERRSEAKRAARNDRGGKQLRAESLTVDLRTDAMTGLLNQQAFAETVRRQIAEWRTHGTPFSVMMVDIDRFKKFGERYGKRAGQLVQMAIPRFLAAAIRETDVIARFGRGEFALLLPYCELPGAAATAERIRNTIASYDRLRLGETVLRFSVSVGVAEAEGNDGTVSLIRRAGTALLAAANAGGNRTYVYDCRTRRAIDALTLDSDSPK